MQQEFNPNAVTFDEGLERIRRAQADLGLNQKTEILTSRDKIAREAQHLLTVTNVPDSRFTKWQLPVYLERPSQLFITVAEPGIEVPEHSHDEGDGIRFIVSGSIHYGEHELTAGDWMFVPAGAKYSFRVGIFGAVMCYCYCCSCAGKMDLNLGAPVESGIASGA
jgi:mannose-6-phosphate isomerase-like protein (cupin superfamily)